MGNGMSDYWRARSQAKKDTEVIEALMGLLLAFKIIDDYHINNQELIGVRIRDTDYGNMRYP